MALVRWVSICLRSDADGADRLLVERRHVRRRRRRRRAEDVLQDVLAANDDRGPRRIAGHREHAALAQHAAALGGGRARRAGTPARSRRRCRSTSPGARSGTCSARRGTRRSAGSRAGSQSKNIRVSVFIASRSSGVQAGNFCGSGLMLSRLRISSHWPAKFSAIANAFGSASIRFTCASSTAGVLSWRRSASDSSSLVGHRVPEEVAQPRGQLDVRDPVHLARDRSGSRSRSMWNRKCGDTSIAWIARAMPCSTDCPSAFASATNFVSAATSAPRDRPPVRARAPAWRGSDRRRRRPSSDRRPGSSCGSASRLRRERPDDGDRRRSTC